MRNLILIAAVLMLGLSAAQAQTPSQYVKPDLKSLEGTWRVVARVCERSGRPARDAFVLGRDLILMNIEDGGLDLLVQVDGRFVEIGKGIADIRSQTLVARTTSPERSRQRPERIPFELTSYPTLILSTSGFGPGGSCASGETLKTYLRKDGAKRGEEEAGRGAAPGVVKPEPARASRTEELLGAEMKQIVKFTKPLSIAFSDLKATESIPDLHRYIETARSENRYRPLSVVVVGGEVVQVTDTFGGWKLNVRSLFDLVMEKTKPSVLARPHVLGTNEDVSFCVIDINTAKLERDEANQRYTYSVNEEMWPYPNSTQKEKFRVNGATVTEEVYGMYVELAPKDRPNEFTHHRRSDEIPSFRCFREAADNRGLRLKDFLQVMSPQGVQVRFE